MVPIVFCSRIYLCQLLFLKVIKKGKLEDLDASLKSMEDDDDDDEVCVKQCGGTFPVLKRKRNGVSHLFPCY